MVKVPTHKQTHRQDRLQYTAAMISAHCNDTGIMPHRGTLSDDARLTSVCLTSVCLPVAYIGPKSRTERTIERLNIGTEVAHVTRDSDTTFKVKVSV